MNNKIGIVDVGGGFRGIYASGIFDYCLDTGIQFDLGIGVSAGSANLASYAAKQPRRNYQFYTEYGMRKEYAGIRNFLFKKSFIDLDYIYGTLSNSDGESPLDYRTIIDNPMEMLVVATNAQTGDVKYFEKNDLKKDAYHILKASSAIPFVCTPYWINNTPYYDGALADSVPIEKAFQMGCDKVVLILTLPVDTVRQSQKDKFLANRIKKKYPHASKQLALRAKHYNDAISLALKYQRQGKLLIVSPNDTCGVSTLSRDPNALKQLYEKGYRDGEQIKIFLEDKKFCINR